MESFYSAAYWGARQESVESCAARTQRLLAAIEIVSPDFSCWRKRGRSKKDALASERITADSLEAFVSLLSKGGNRRDIGGDVIDELGYSMSAWNGGDKENVSGLSIKCGLYSCVGGCRML
ncbi:Imm52 family immunity protein [Cupriavidus basilensis]|uniref:Imm52 family immunity protein n=1 Tax=Cupriavidus basilensis TaxID=68895 RepID=UPI0018CCC124|nr:Imm52 family immunity protein [Cupriavidus basilensis]